MSTDKKEFAERVARKYCESRGIEFYEKFHIEDANIYIGWLEAIEAVRAEDLPPPGPIMYKPQSAPTVSDLKGWQPIETAPKDGTAFLAASGNWIVCMCWNKHRRDWCTVDKHYCPLPDDETFTHWMLLPAPPAEVQP